MRRRRTGIYAALPLVVLLLVLVRVALAASTPAASPPYWVPPHSLTWYWQLSGTPQVKPVQATDFDGFDNSAATVASFHALGQHVICYIDVGTWEDWRSDAAAFPSSVLGQDNGWPGERWLDISQLSVIEPIMTARFQMCAQKGFDAVEPDNMDGWENSTGFPITAAQQLAYDEWVATEVHSLGMAVLQKNDPEQATQLEPYFDGALDEQCNEYSECSSYQPYLSAGKPVLNAEYTSSLYPGFCTADNQLGIMGALYAVALDGSIYTPCWSTTTTTTTTTPTPAPTPTTPTTPTTTTTPATTTTSTTTTPTTPDSPPPRHRHRRSGFDNAAPTVAIGAVAIGAGGLADPRRTVGLRLSCPVGQSYCDGAVELDSLRRLGFGHGALLLGRKHFHIAGGHRAVIKFKLSRRVTGKFGKATIARLVAKATARDAAGRHATTRRTLTLALRKVRTR